MSATLESGREFLLSHARLVDRRVLDRVLGIAQTGSVAAALRAYRNPDGGLGHALEPDLRTSTSQPIFIDAGLAILIESAERDEDLVKGTCEFLAVRARADGAIPYVLPDAMEHARADHWKGDYAVAPSLHATAGVCGKLLALGARHEWLDRATAWCLTQVEGEPDYSPHTIWNVMELLLHAPDRERSERLWKRVTARLFEADYVLVEIPATTYGLSPLRFAPSPDHPARPLFADDLIERHLDHLAAQQEPDGGWPLSWEPPGQLAVEEWRGRVAVRALLELRAYGRI